MINWEEQWAVHAPNFHEGVATVSLPFSQKIHLKSGPGFGDFSHPTTQLMIELIPSYVKDQTVVDIGCGSGILTTAAAKLGASSVIGYDIDQEAMEHAQKNILLNHLTHKASIGFPKTLLSPPVILMNMISSEQKEAWKSYHPPFQYLITSGILASEETSYLTYATGQNWQLIEKREKQGWLAFIFINGEIK